MRSSRRSSACFPGCPGATPLPLPLRRAAVDADGEANSLNNLGKVYDKLGDRAKAREYLEQALAKHRTNVTLSLLDDDHQLLASLPRMWTAIEDFLGLLD